MSAVAAYDAIGARYANLESENRILRMMRARSLALLLSAMPRGGRLLELGSGDGEEALAVAEGLGASVVAVEPAPSLAAAVERRARERSLRIEVDARTASAALADLAAKRAQFDGAWSSFALGYDAPLAQLEAPLSAVLPAGAPLVLSLRNPWCLAEPWSIPRRATGRYRHKVGAARVPVAHYSLRAARRALAGNFEFVSAQALPVIVPPPRYGKAWNRLGKVAAFFEARDGALATHSPFRALGDHTLLVFRRR